MNSSTTLNSLDTGLSALYEEARTSDESETLLKVSAILDNPYQPRSSIDEETIEGLARSIDSDIGLLQPILVRKDVSAAGRYILIAGQRRLLAIKKLGRSTIRASIREIDERSAALASLIENLQRESLAPLDQAKQYQLMMDDFQMKQSDLARLLGVHHSTIGPYLALLSMPDFLKEALDDQVSESPQTFAELRKAHTVDPERTERFVAGQDKISRDEAKAFYKQLAEKELADNKPHVSMPAPGGGLDRGANEKLEYDDPEGLMGAEAKTHRGLLDVDEAIKRGFQKAYTEAPVPGAYLRMKQFVIEAIGKDEDLTNTADAIVWALILDRESR